MQKKAILRKRLLKERINGLLITDLANVRYLSGFTGTSGYIIITQKHALLLTDFRYREQARDEVKGHSVIIEHSERSKEVRDV
ncbi:MAG: aminopeptidase P family N-terminal domain-containing protein, partial [Nitrospirota bacterium]|nr:aminopeptidase P family N-terminal domain-containing protein [Nitrospirota bacterium]